MILYHAKSQTVADGTATSVVRPSDWNSAHVLTQQISGNTLGSSTVAGTNLVLQGGNNVTLSASTAANAATIIISGPNVSQYLTTAAQVAHTHDYAASDHTHSQYINTSASSLFQHTSVTSAITSAALHTSNSSLLQHTSATSAITSNAYPSANTTKFAGTGTSATNASITMNSNGLAINVAAGAADGVNVLSASGNTAGTMATQSTGTVVLAGGNNITLSQSSNSISIIGANPGGAAAIPQYWACPEWVQASNALVTNLTALSKAAVLFPINIHGTMSVQECMFPLSKVTSNQDAQFTVQWGLYSYSNSTRIDLISSTQNPFSVVSSFVAARSVRQWELEFNGTYVSLTPGQYVVGMWFSANGDSTSAMNLSMMGAATGNPVLSVIHAGTNSSTNHVSHAPIPFWGRHSVTSNALRASYALSDVLGGYSGASLPLPMHFTLGTHN